MRTPSEFEIIERYFKRETNDPDVILGIGDDAALVAARGDLAVATDTLVAGTHFLAALSPDLLARRALAVNVSDLAAMGAHPRWFTLALTMPESDAKWLDEFASGLHAAAGQYAVSLIGGDLTRGPLSVTMQFLGTIDTNSALLRSGARPGDLVFVTGTIGDAAAGLQLRKDRVELTTTDQNFLVSRYEVPTARVAAGIALRGIATAAIDISDGLVNDLTHLCNASSCGAKIDVDNLPLSQALIAVFGSAAGIDFALSGGDDYELCFTAPSDHKARVHEVLAGMGLQVAEIGSCRAMAGVEVNRRGEMFNFSSGGYRHF